MTSDLTLRERTRGAVRDEVLREAWTLFSEHGFEGTTIDMVAEAAGMSRRSFFRYFDSKDELVLARLVESVEPVAEALRVRPAEEPAWPALRAAFEELVGAQEANADRVRSLYRMLRDEPALRAPMEERRRRWHELLVPLVAVRIPARPGSRTPDTRAAALTAAAVACLDAAQSVWIQHPGAELGGLLDEAMGTLSPLV